MKKYVITFIMAGFFLFSSAAECVHAASVLAEENTVVEKETTVTEDDITEELLQRAGGLQQPEIHEIEYGSLSEVYEEEIENTGKGSAVYQHAWDSYSTNYYYNQLSDNAQAFWDQLNTMCLGYLTGTETVSSARDNEGNTVYPTKSVVFSNMTGESAINVALMFKYSNPQYYFLDLGMYRSTLGNGELITLTIFPAFANGASRAAATAQMQSVIDSWMPIINAQPSEQLKEKMAHDLICKKVVYDPGYEDKSIPMNEYNQVAFSVFCTDSTVCAGYSQAMQLLMNGAGIDCAVVTSLDHEWNIIRINNIWYYTDLTWNDIPESKTGIYGQDVGYMYFNRSNQMFMSDEPQLAAYHTPELMWNGYLPELTYDSGATWTDIGVVGTPSATLTAPQITCSGDVVTLTAPAGGTIYYTTDGSNPSIAFTRADKYTGPFTVTKTTAVKAVAVANGYFDSGVSEATVVPQFTVKFNANGGYIGSKSVKTTSKTAVYGNKMGKLLSPKRKNYAFIGWYTKKSGGSKITSATQITGSKTYYAHWAKIKPVKSSISSVKNTAAKTMKVKIKNISTASGYQIRYSLKKNMSSAKKVTVSENTCTINKLKKGKTYYVQVRMYQQESVTGKTTYGTWSKVKTVKIKK